jgi:hypothetical protein
MSHLDSEPPIFFDDGVFFDDAPPATPRKNMAKILRNWSKLPRKDRLGFAKKIKTNLAQVPPPIANPNPTVAQLETLYTAADSLINEVDALEILLKAKRAARDDALDALMAGIEQEAKTVEAVPGITPGEILATGYDLAGVPQPAPAPTQPLDLSVTAGDNDGSLDWHSHPLRGSSGMEVSSTATPNDPASWVSHGTVPQSSGTITGLPSGIRRYVRIRGIFPGGPGPWSDLAARMVP